jgi:hypothetical protein
MQTILRILKQAGGWHHGLYIKIENPPYMALVIEATDESGPCGLPSISVAHYGEQNGEPIHMNNFANGSGDDIGNFVLGIGCCHRSAIAARYSLQS